MGELLGPELSAVRETLKGGLAARLSPGARLRAQARGHRRSSRDFSPSVILNPHRADLLRLRRLAFARVRRDPRPRMLVWRPGAYSIALTTAVASSSSGSR